LHGERRVTTEYEIHMLKWTGKRLQWEISLLAVLETCWNIQEIFALRQRMFATAAVGESQ
jgi:hypothetical protein